MRSILWAGVVHGLTLGMQATVIGVAITLIVRFSSPELSTYIQRIALVYYGLVAEILLLLSRLMMRDWKANPALYNTLGRRIVLLTLSIIIAVIWSSLLFIGYGATVRFAPSLADSEALTSLYETLQGAVLGLPLLISLVIGTLGGWALAFWGFDRATA